MKDEILTVWQRKFLKSFFSCYLGKEFFLTGGTALAAFYLHHRLSEDLDLFTINQNVNLNEVNAEVRKIALSHKLKVEHRVSSPTFSQFFLSPKNEKLLKIDLVKDIPLRFGKLKKINNFLIDSLENISVNKMLAIYGRLDGKDFIDLYFLLKQKLINLEKIFQMAKKKDPGLNKFYFANTLMEIKNIKYFPKTLDPLDKKRLVNFFLKLSTKLFKEIKPKKF